MKRLQTTLNTVFKRSSYLAFLVVFGLSSLGIVSSTAYALSGTGTQNDPYQITTCQDLQDIANDLDAYYILKNDINCADFTDFAPIGDGDTPFMGELDGQGYAVRNLTIDQQTGRVGLFGQIGQSDNQVGLVKDLGVEDVSVTGDWSVGAMVGVLYGQVNNVYSTGEVSGDIEVGGLVGSHGGIWDTIINSYSAANVTGEDDVVGGLVGFNAQNSYITNSYATGDVSGEGNFVGGLVGNNNGFIQQSHATGNVSSGGSNAGGLVGNSDLAGDIYQSYATGDVTAVGNNIGGLVGRNDGQLKQSYSNNVNAGGFAAVDGNCHVGGLVGYNDQNGYVMNNYTRSSVTTNTNQACEVGGFVGTNVGSIIRAYSTGAVSGAIMARGGFAGTVASPGSVYVSFWDENTSGLNVGCNQLSDFDCTATNRVMGKSTAVMKQMNTYIDGLNASYWHFPDPWSFVAGQNDDYPVLVAGATPTPQPEPETDMHGFISPLTGKGIMVELPGSCSFVTHFKTEAELSVKDAAYDYADGLVGFVADCGTPGLTATVSQYYLGVQQDSRILRKYNARINGFFTINDATFEQVTLDGDPATKVTYTVTDGGERDADGLVDGNITDPAGLAQAVLSAPNTGLGGDN